MVYGGKPSTGCRNCKLRHIKCDETRPNCRACTRTGRSCPGYPDPFDVMLRDQTASFTKATRPSPVASEKSISSKTSSISRTASSKYLSPANSIPPLGSWPPKLGPADLYQPMEDTVVPLFFNSYLYLPKDPHFRNGYTEILPSLYSNAENGSYLHISTLAVASFSVAVWTGQRSLLRASEQNFTKALPKIRDALQRNEDSELDSILVSILLLGTYEEFVAIKDWQLPLKAHLRGAIALINSRRAKALPSPSSSTIYGAVETQIIRTASGLSNSMVPVPKVWPLSQPSAPDSPRLLFLSAASQLVNLRHAWEEMMAQPNPTPNATTILNKATIIDNNLVSWSYRVPQHWVPVAASIIPQSVRNAGIYRNRCDCYSDMWIAATWNNYRECRILVQNIKLSCLRILSAQDPDGRRSAAVTTTIHKLADDTCATVPFFLGSQMESVRMKPGLVEYPFAETRPVTPTHKQAAPLMAAWFLFAFLRNLQNSDLSLPMEQQTWIEGQITRVLGIYFQW